MDIEVVRAPDLRGYVCAPWCADSLVCAERALVRHPRRMDVYTRAGRPAGGGGWSPLAELRDHAHARARSDFFVPPVSNAHELGDMRSSCSLPCPPNRNACGRATWGTSRGTSTGTGGVHNREHGQAGAGACGLTRTCAVVANRPHRATCGFAPARLGSEGQLSLSLGLIRAAAVVPIWHHRVTLGSTELRRVAVCDGLENKPDNYGSAKLAGPYDLDGCVRRQRRNYLVQVSMSASGRRTRTTAARSEYQETSAPRPRRTSRNKPDKYAPADLAGRYDLDERLGARRRIYPVQASI